MERRVYEKTLKFAIHNEVKAHDFYLQAADKLQDEFLKQMFTDFAQEENRHKVILENLRGADPETIEFGDVPDYHIAESVDEPELSIDMKPADAFALAMKKEQDAMELYTWMASACADLRQRDLLLELAAMEKEHKFRMENAFIEVGYPEVW